MKKLIFALFVILLSSCGYSPIDNSSPVIVKRIELSRNGYCDYYGKGNLNMTNIFAEPYFKIRDICGKYNIGDTIKFTK